MDWVIWGGTGQAKVVRPILQTSGHELIAIFDNDQTLSSPFPDKPLLGGMEAFEAFRSGRRGSCGFVVAIGGVRGETRCGLSEMLLEAGLEPLSAIHGRAFVAESATLGRGSQVMAMAAISEDVEVGDFCIINTSASVDHDSRIGRGVHIMPGATVAGAVRIGDYASVGSNATILPRIRIGERSVVGAGAVVTRDVEPGATVIGSPARPTSNKSRPPSPATKTKQ